MKKLKYSFFGIIILLLLSFVYFVTYTFAEPKAYDFMTKYVLTEKLPFDRNKNVYGHDDIVLVVVDDKTVEKYRWPWKRENWCKIFDYFSEYTQPKAIIYDFLVAAPDIDNPESDKKFFDSIKKSKNLINSFSFDIEHWNDYEAEKEYNQIFTKKYAVDVESNLKLANAYTSFRPLFSDLIKVVENVGFVDILPGFIDNFFNLYTHDEIYRNHSYFIMHNGAFFPSTAMKSFLISNKNPHVIVNKDYIEFPTLDYKIKQITKEYLMYTPLKFYKLNDDGFSHKKFSVTDIITSYDEIKNNKKPKINPETFKNKVILIGGNVTAAPGLNDNKNTPVSILHPGVDIQATAVDNLVHNDFLTVLPKWFNTLVTILGMLFVFYTIKSHRLFKAVTYSIFVMFLYFMASIACFYNCVIINVITPVVMFVITMIIGYIYNYFIENRNKEKVESAMGKYMSEDVMNNVLKNIDNLGLGGKKATVTVLFSDIRGFTALSEKMTAPQVSELLNEYFSEMEPIVSKYNGIINKFIGDAVMAVFGEPIQDENHAKNAVKCGFEMLKKVEELDKKWASEGKPSIQIGVGVNTGEVFVGNIGSEKRMEYTVIGDTVNLASRLESYNKTYKTKILISSSTYDASKDIVEVNRISDVEIRGKSEKMDIYEIINVL